MLVEQLTINNFGTYQGQNVFDLSPRIKYGSTRPVILFGGLNGAGKTTFLNAVRLALYGRQGLDAPLTDKEYNGILKQLIHSSPDQLVQADRASVEIIFTYARLGEIVRYRVHRSWVAKGNHIDVSLQVFTNDAPEPSMRDDQAQALLSQLIPFGVSQFFFFDGEQIAELAKDDADEVLSDAIRRLLGLDIADRLNSDLSIFVRQKRIVSSSDDARDKLKELHRLYDTLMSEVDAAQQDMQNNLQPQLDQAISAKEQMRSKLSDRGGAWAIDRADVERSLSEVKARKQALEAQLRDLLSGVAVFSFAPRLCTEVAGSVQTESKVLESRLLVASVKEKVEGLKTKFSRIKGSSTWRPVAVRCVDEWVAEITPPPMHKSKIVHGLTGSEAEKLLDTISKGLPASATQLEHLIEAISGLTEEELRLQDKLALAPTESSIEEAFGALERAIQKVAVQEAQKQSVLAEMRRKLWQAIDVTRKKRKLEKEAQAGGVTSRAEYLAEGVQEILSEFKMRSAQRRCDDLRGHFVSAFRRLSRKSDIIADARIDAANFSMTLLDKMGQEVPKARLSAGEKQIFAIAMLEALGKTSGRSLPVIIDTPLGRLDSQHREKLVQSYFPKASHQVIVLSTDTEVDQRFYDGLRSSISHAYHLNFDPAERRTTVEEGYFWKSRE
ncbi:MAG: DNA sulfur modification protein DndD [Polaromonas sp.]|uniref:DNA sulfur modification protein DndD n=1 Tax=Polaromonas sp. TaxID=1869339 RepID=UPI0027319B60|nr:DNA sulfur modification protein DndD [Polaromonas sp.]MDP2450752.1 DNA sulfur modification protein DndD [Polaromonas sp.]MDP3246257.1 DNA sulfur modification protein DndD [Polaromonas sp.]MDP3754903.1 DNA sulfur modification protein DndD [Polaromonas sp.]